MTAPNSHLKRATERDAALYQSVVVPRYSRMFGQMILDEIPPKTQATILDFACRTGHPATEILERLEQGGRVMAIDPDRGMLDLARRRAHEYDGKKVFFKSESVELTSFGDHVFDLAIGNLAFDLIRDPDQAILQLRRILIPGGRVLLTRPTTGTFQELFDMFREVSEKYDDKLLMGRVDSVSQRYPTLSSFEALLDEAGFENVHGKQQTFRMEFRNAQEMWSDPLIRFVALADWEWIADARPNPPDVWAEMLSCMDTYFGPKGVYLTVEAGLVSGTTPILVAER